jgi:hypothetical protein
MSTSTRKVARGIGGFALFLVVYSLAGSISATLIVFSFARLILWAPPADGSAIDMFMLLCSAVLAGFLGVVLGALALGAVMKDNYPARGIGVAFVTWLLANYLGHFLFFPNSHIPNLEVYTGLLQSVVAVATTWFTFGLPPLSLKLP